MAPVHFSHLKGDAIGRACPEIRNFSLSRKFSVRIDPAMIRDRAMIPSVPASGGNARTPIERDPYRRNRARLRGFRSETTRR